MLRRPPNPRQPLSRLCACRSRTQRTCSATQRQPVVTVSATSISSAGVASAQSRGQALSAATPHHRQLASLIKTCSDTAALSQLIQQHAAALRINHVHDALTQVAKLKQSPPSAADEACIRQLVGLATAMLPGCDCQGLALMAQAVKKTRHKDPAFTQELVAQATSQLQHFKPKAAGSLFRALTKLNCKDEDFLARLQEQAAKGQDRDMRRFTASLLACNSVDSLMQLVQQRATSTPLDCIHASTSLVMAAKLMQTPLTSKDQASVNSLITLAWCSLADCDSRAIASMAWALATLGYRDTAFVQELVQQASKQLPQFSAHSKGRMLWALRQLGCEDEAFLQQLQAQNTQHKQGDQQVSPGADEESVTRQLTRAIRACGSAERLTQLVRQQAERLNHIHACTALMRAAKLLQQPLSAEEQACVGQLVELARTKLPDCDGRQLAGMAWAAMHLQHGDPAFMQQLGQQASRRVSEFDAKGAATVLQALTKHGLHDELGAFMQQLQEQQAAAAVASAAASAEGVGAGVKSHPPHFPQPLSIVIAACDSVDSLAQLVQRQAQALYPTQASTALCRLVKLMQPPLSLSDEACARTALQLVQLAESRLPAMGANDLAKTAWAVATLGFRSQAFLSSLLQRLGGRVQELSGRGTTSMLWALAKLGSEDEALIRQLVAQAGDNVGEFRRHDIFNTLQALVMLRPEWRDAGLVGKLVERAQPQLEGFNRHQVVDTAYALAVLQHDDPRFTQQLLRQAASSSSQLNATAVSDLLWAMAKLRQGSADRRLVQALIAQAKELGARSGLKVSTQRMCNLAWALVALRHDDRDLMQLLVQEASSRMAANQLDHNTLANLLRAMAVLGHDDPHFVNDAVNAVHELLQQDHAISLQDTRKVLCNVLWALSMLQHDAASVAEPLINAAVIALNDQEPGPGDPGMQLRNCHQYLVTMEGAGVVSSRLQATIWYRQLRAGCREAMRQVAGGYASAGPVQQAVLAALRRLPGCGGAEMQQLTEDGDIYASLCFTLPGGTKVRCVTYYPLVAAMM